MNDRVRERVDIRDRAAADVVAAEHSNRTQPAGRLPRPLTDAAVATLGSTVYLLGGISTAPTATITIVHPGAGR